MKRLIAIALVLVSCSAEPGESDVAVEGVTDATSDTGFDAEVEDTNEDSMAHGSDVVPGDVTVPDDTEVAESSPAIDSRLVVPGACTNIMDVSFLDDPDLGLVDSCRSACITSLCAVARLVELARITTDCATCYIERWECDLAVCGAANCADQACRDCSETQCEPEFGFCAGVLSSAERANPVVGCRPSERTLEFSSVEFAETGNLCSSRCNGGACVAECLAEETELGPGCANCFGDWWDCSSQECLATCDVQFSNECIECGGYRECTTDLLGCLNVDPFIFVDLALFTATIRTSVVAERASIAVVTLEGGSPLIRNLSTGIVTGFLPIDFRDQDRLGLTEGNVGGLAEIASEVVGAPTPNRSHTLMIYDSAGELKGFLFEEPRLGGPAMRVFNGLDSAMSATLVEDSASWTLESGEMGQAEPIRSPATVEVNGVAFDVPEFGSAASIVFWVVESGDGIRARVTTASGGFSDLTRTPE